MILNQVHAKALGDLECIPIQKISISTINAHSYNVARKDRQFFQALEQSDFILPDGIGVVLGYRVLGKKVKKIAGADLFAWQMQRLNQNVGSCFFLGSSEETLKRIQQRAKKEYPNVRIESYSPPYKAEFTKEDNEAMIAAVNAFSPDVLFIGMTAPKQEKWAYEHFKVLNAQHICCIGAVFDFYAGTIKRPPKWMIKLGLEWLGRFIKEPRRMWRRYLISSPVIIFDALKYRLAIALGRKPSPSFDNVDSQIGA
jgi:N-acetylglucosaminyldiphosphoundecaprenol N-acetyl-beta-D-mannosaminyltransferase